MSASPSSFMDLPTELRLQIYAHALAPTESLFLTRTATQRFATRPALPLALLRVSRRVHREAAPFVCGANELAVAIDAHNTTFPVISESRLPQRVLEQLEHVFVVLDCTQWFRTAYRNVDFAAFEALTALRSLRLALVYDSEAAAAAAADGISTSCRVCQSSMEEGADVADLLAEILARVPRRTRVLFEVVEGSPQAACVQSVLDNRRLAMGRNSHHVVVMAAEQLEAALAAVPEDVRGSQSGGNENVYAEWQEDGKASMWRSVAAKVKAAELK